MAEEIKEVPAAQSTKPKKIIVTLKGGGSCYIEGILFKKGVEREVSPAIADVVLKTGFFVKK